MPHNKDEVVQISSGFYHSFLENPSQTISYGTHHNRDFNAAQNIKKEGQKILIGSRSPEFTLVDNHNTDWMKQEEKVTQV